MSDGFYREPVNVEKMLAKLGIEAQERNGKWWACCPLHSEKTPSFRVIDDPGEEKHGQWRCHGKCKQGGWPFQLVMKVTGCDREDALRWLKDVNQAPPIPFSITLQEYEQGFRHAAAPTKLQMPVGFTTHQLDAWPWRPKEYAIEERHLKDWQVIKWGLGYTTTGYNEETNPSPGRLFVPVKDKNGKLNNYTGRTYVNSRVRYKNATLADGADPAAIFGEQFWPKIKRFVVVCEGAFNGLAVERVHPELALAVLNGSNVHENHVQKISQFECAIIATDPDGAGQSASSELSQKLVRWTRVVQLELPPGKDCDSMEPSHLKKLLDEALEEDNEKKALLEQQQKERVDEHTYGNHQATPLRTGRGRPYRAVRRTRSD